MTRCIHTLHKIDNNRPVKQTAAICYNQWNKKESMHPDFERVLGLFINRYGESEGAAKFSAFVQKNKVDVSKQYHPSAQFAESFSWVEPLITKYRQDSEAKYYLVRALTANISMKNTDWSDYVKMQKAAETLSWRPVNLNHDHSTWFSYPRTRVDFTKADDFSVEATLRVDNKDHALQDMLDSGKILHPSIEARANLDGGYQFTAMALVVAGEDLPGDPLTEITPLMFNESIGKAVCKMINGEIVCECKNQESMNEVKQNLKDKIEDKIEEAFGDASFPDSCFAFVPDSAKGADGNKSERKLPYKNADGTVDLPHVRNALARLNQTTGIPSDKKEAIQKTLENILAKENQKETLGLQETIAQERREKADVTMQLTAKTKENTDLKTESINKDGENAKLKEEKAALIRETLKIPVLETQNKTLIDSLTATKSELNETMGKVEAKSAEITKLEININKDHTQTVKLEEALGKFEVENEKLRRDLNEESTKRASAEQKALNETKESSRVKLENAELLDQQAGYIKKESVLSDQLSVNAKRKLELEIKYNESMGETQKLKDEITLQSSVIERLKLSNKKDHKIFEQYGIAEVTKDGFKNPADA